jgi:hypothetical protein
MMLRLKAFIAMLAVSLGLGLSPAAHADTEIVAIPTSWRLQNYIGTPGLVAWFTGSSCSNGVLNFSSTSTADDRNRFYSLVLTAKVSGKSIGVYYETVSGNCQIQSFYIQQ